MENQRTPIQIDKNLHCILKKYCKDNCIILGALVEKLIKDKLQKDGYSISTQEKGR